MPTISPGRTKRGRERRAILAAVAARAPLAGSLLLASPAVASEQRPAQAESTVSAEPTARPAPEPHSDATIPAAPAATAGAAAGSVLEPIDELSLFEEPPRRLRKLGLMFDLGTMGGGMMSMVYRPVQWLRVFGGAGTNGAAPGVRMGAVVSPWQDTGWSFSVDGGHFFPGDVNGLFAAFAGSDYDDSHLLEHFDYDFVTLQLGWEIERGDLLFFARGGVGLLWTQLPSDDLGRISNLSSFVDPDDGSIQALLPSLSLGIIGFL